MHLEKIGGMLQGMSAVLSNNTSNTNFNLNRYSVLSIENSSDKYINASCLNDKSMDEPEEPIYMDMRKDVTCVSNSYEIFYDKDSDNYLFDKSLFLFNQKINSFSNLSENEKKSIIEHLKSKGFDTNKLLTKAPSENSINKAIDESIEENIYETIHQDCLLKEKLELADGLSKIIYQKNKVNGNFKDGLIKSISDVSLDELFSSCNKYEENYDIQEFFLINRFIYLFIENFNKLNNNEIKVNEDLKKRLNSFILLKNLKLKNNNII